MAMSDSAAAALPHPSPTSRALVARDFPAALCITAAYLLMITFPSLLTELFPVPEIPIVTGQVLELTTTESPRATLQLTPMAGWLLLRQSERSSAVLHRGDGTISVALVGQVEDPEIFFRRSARKARLNSLPVIQRGLTPNGLTMITGTAPDGTRLIVLSGNGAGVRIVGTALGRDQITAIDALAKGSELQ